MADQSFAVAVEPRSRRSSVAPRTATVVVVLVGLAITSGLSYGAWRLNDTNENRLLRQQVRQAGSALTAGIQTVETPLVAGAEGAHAGGIAGFVSVMTPVVGTGKQFMAAALWTMGSTRPLAVIGDPKLVRAPEAQIASFLARSTGKPHLAVNPMLDSGDPRLGYSYNEADSPTTLVVYTETRFAPDRTHIQRRTDAYRNVEYALYVTTSESLRNLIAASTPRLPIAGRRASTVTPFGDTTLLLAMTPKTNLGGWLSGNLWWIVLLAGAAISIGAAMLVNRLARRRDDAVDLVQEVSRLYEEQRGIAATLQRALLPDTVPHIDGLEIATRYEPAALHSEVGGDWFDVVAVGDRSALVIVGDVSGHGVAAATVMASLRFAAQAFVSEGNGPGQVVGKLENMLDLERDGQFATVVCALLDLTGGRITVANAGHPDLIVADADGVRMLGSRPGPPVGMQREPPAETTFILAPTGTVLAFTDGLFERRGEDIDVGLRRVRDCLLESDDTLEELLDRTVAEVVPPGHADDVAMVAVRWTVNTKAAGAV